MRKFLLLSVLSAFISTVTHSQVNLEKKWDHTYGGNFIDVLKTFFQTPDGGFLLGGTTQSDSGYDVSHAARGGMDYWVVKTDSLGEKMWDVRFGSSDEEEMYSAAMTLDGGYILGGYTRIDSANGDVSEHTKGSLDYWIVKIDSVGNKLWDRRYGGSDYDQMTSVVAASDGGYLLGGWTFSDSSGDISEPTRGGEDFWIIKVDGSGNKLWDKRYGGNLIDQIWYMQQTSDGGFAIGGRTTSDISGEVTDFPRGETDYWLVKTDNNGNVEWDKRFGGNLRDHFLALKQTSDGGFVLGGYTRSDSSFDITENPRDTAFVNINNRGDIWIVKTDSAGTTEWDKRFGSVWRENAFGHIIQTMDGGYLWAAASYSGIGGDKSEANFGFEQSWMVRMDSAGNKVWDKTIFVSGEDEYGYPLELSDGCIVMANWSFGDSAGYKSEFSRGNWDYWMIKFCETSVPQIPVASFWVSNPSTCAGGCFDFNNTSYNSGTFQWYFPGGNPSSSTMTSPNQICYPDTGTFAVTLIAISPNGNDTLFETNIFTIFPLSPIEISQTGDTLSVPTGFVTYQWYFNNIPLPNDTTNSTVATQNGQYVVIAYDANGCPNSDTIPSFNVGITDLSPKGYELSVYPNPASGNIYVDGVVESKTGTVRIFDVAGRIVYSGNLLSSELSIDVSYFRPGMYILEVISEQQKMFSRFIKQ